MKNSIFFTPFAIVALIAFWSCKKTPEPNPCTGLTEPKAEFTIQEVLRDTAFDADTIFRNNTARFKALKPYSSVVWQIGGDPRSFTQPQFGLSFVNNLETVEIGFTGTGTPNSNCFPLDSGIYKGVKRLTIVEQLDKATLTMSPLVGKYHGAFSNTPADTFTIRIDYFDSTKYDVSSTGSKNFYWLSNMPKGFRDTTSSLGGIYPELSYGQYPAMGFKCFSFGDGASIVGGKGVGELKKDTLKIYYFHPITGPQTFVGKRL